MGVCNCDNITCFFYLQISRMSSELNTVRQQLSMVESVQLRFNSVDAELTSLREKVRYGWSSITSEFTEMIR